MELTDFVATAQCYPWHHEVWQRLTQRLDHFPHALLLQGKQGCGKLAFASFLVQWLLCEQKQATGACQQCTSCTWFMAGTHPQFKWVCPDFDEKRQRYGALKIEQIRELSDFVQQTGQGFKVVVLYPAENLNVAAANALLKTLEEPAERVVFLLVSHQAQLLPATILSRSQKIALDRISLSQSQAFLAEQGIASTKQMTALNLAADMPLHAQQIAQSQWFAQRQDFVKDWINLVQRKQQPMRFANDWGKQLDFAVFSHLLRYLTQDCIAIKLGQALKQTDLAIEQLAQHYTLEQLFSFWQQIQTAVIMSQQNVQTNLLIDELVMQMMNVPKNA